MLKRDSLTAQMQQLSHTLAKVKRLIVENQEAEAQSAIRAALGDYFGTSITDLLETPTNLFRQQFSEQEFDPQELGLLADFLDEAANMEGDDANRRAIWEKMLILYDLLEQEHHVVSFTHIARRAEIAAKLL